jgi:hypothetical protein
MNRSLAEACELMERSPEVKFQSMRVATVNADQQLAIRKELIVDAGDDNQSSRDYHRFSDDALFDVNVWRRLGRATGNSKLDDLRFCNCVGRNENVNEELLSGAARCIHTFFAEAKHNTTSIKTAGLDLTAGASMDDFREFIQNNEALNYLRITSVVPASLE